MDDVLGTQEREEAAIRAYGRWQARVRSAVIASFAIGGIVPMVLAWYAALELQFAFADVAIVYLNALAASLTWLAVIVLGAKLSRRIVRVRAASKLAELAKAYDVPSSKLAETIDLANNLDR